MYYTYILRLSNRSLYTGHSTNLKQRIIYHNSGRVSATKNVTPVKLVFYAAFETKTKAVKFEKYLKSSSGFAFRNKHLV